MDECGLYRPQCLHFGDVIERKPCVEWANPLGLFVCVGIREFNYLWVGTSKMAPLGIWMKPTPTSLRVLKHWRREEGAKLHFPIVSTYYMWPCCTMVNRDQHTAIGLTFMLVLGYVRYFCLFVYICGHVVVTSDFTCNFGHWNDAWIASLG